MAPPDKPDISEKDLNFEDLLAATGGLGKYQIRLIVLVSLSIIPTAFNLYVSLFVLTIPNHRCALEDMLNDTYAVQDKHHQRLIDARIPVNNDGTMSSCHIYLSHANASVSSNSNDSERNSQKCNRWVYDKEFFDRSLIEELDLVCDKTSYRTLANMALLISRTVAHPIQGLIADRYGRRTCAIISIVLLILGNFPSAFIFNVTSLLIVRFLSGLMTNCLYLSLYVLAIEFMEPAYRHRLNVLMHTVWISGAGLLTILAFFIRDFQHLIISYSAPCILIILLAWFVPESPRWLLSKGRWEDAEKVVKKIATCNGCSFPRDLFTRLVKKEKKIISSDGIAEIEANDVAREEIELMAGSEKDGKPDVEIIDGKREGLLSLIRNRILFKRLLLTALNWTFNTMIYYGIMFNMSNLVGSVYINVALLCLVDLIGLMLGLYLADKIGRKKTYAALLLLTVTVCFGSLISIFVVPENSGIAISILALFGRLGISTALNILYIFTAELFATNIRNSVMGFCSTVGRIGSAFGALVGDLGVYAGGPMESVLPLLVCGGLSVLLLVSSIFLPETIGKALPNHAQNAISIEKQTKSRK